MSSYDLLPLWRFDHEDYNLVVYSGLRLVSVFVLFAVVFRLCVRSGATFEFRLSELNSVVRAGTRLGDLNLQSGQIQEERKGFEQRQQRWLGLLAYISPGFHIACFRFGGVVRQGLTKIRTSRSSYQHPAPQIPLDRKCATKWSYEDSNLAVYHKYIDTSIMRCRVGNMYLYKSKGPDVCSWAQIPFRSQTPCLAMLQNQCALILHICIPSDIQLRFLVQVICPLNDFECAHDEDERRGQNPEAVSKVLAEVIEEGNYKPYNVALE